MIKFKLPKFIARLICKHEYRYLYKYKIDGGMSKRIVYICDKCGKSKTETV